MKLKLLLAGAAVMLTCYGVTTHSVSATNDSEINASDQALTSLLLQQRDDSVKSSYDNGITWNELSEPSYDFYNYEEFADWIKTQQSEIELLVEAGEWDRNKADTVLREYNDILERIDNGLFVSERKTPDEWQYFVSYPDNVQVETYQTALYNDNNCKYFGPFDTEQELYSAIEAYVNTEVDLGHIAQDEAATILSKHGHD